MPALVYNQSTAMKRFIQNNAVDCEPIISISAIGKHQYSFWHRGYCRHHASYITCLNKYL